MTYNDIKYNYEHKLWFLAIVKIAVKKGLITKEEYKKITGLDY